MISPEDYIEIALYRFAVLQPHGGIGELAPRPPRRTTGDRMATHRRLNRSRVYLDADELHKRALAASSG